MNYMRYDFIVVFLHSARLPFFGKGVIAASLSSDGIFPEFQTFLSSRIRAFFSDLYFALSISLPSGCVVEMSSLVVWSWQSNDRMAATIVLKVNFCSNDPRCNFVCPCRSLISHLHL